MIKVGVLLAGCGLYDGTDVAEAVITALALERSGACPQFLCPDVPQMQTVDHLTGSEEEGVVRHVAAESGRIARGRLKSLTEQFPGELMGLIIPGGHGTVKNLMTNFAQLGKPREILPSVRGLLENFTSRKAPIGSISLGHTIVQAFLDEPLSENDMSMAATQVLVDESRRMSFTPGFLSGGTLAEVAVGIEKLVASVLRMASTDLKVLQ